MRGVLGGGQRRGAGHEQPARRERRRPTAGRPRRRRRAGGTSSARRRASSRRRSSAAAIAVGREATEVDDAAAEAQRPERAEHEPVDVEQRQRVDQHVVAVHSPRVGERVEVRRDRASRQLDALRRPGRPRRVDDQRGSLVVARRAVAVGRSGERGAPRGSAASGRRAAPRPRGDDEVGPAVGDHVGELALARRRVDRHDCDTRRRAPRRRRRPCRARRRADGDAVGAGDARRDPAGGARQLVVTEALAGDRDRRPRPARGELRQQHAAAERFRRRPVSRSAIAGRLPGRGARGIAGRGPRTRLDGAPGRVAVGGAAAGVAGLEPAISPRRRAAPAEPLEPSGRGPDGPPARIR